MAQWLAHLEFELGDPTLSKLFTHITSPSFSAPRNWGTQGSFSAPK